MNLLNRRAALKALSENHLLPSSTRMLSTSALKERSYSDAVAALNTLQANHATIERIRQNPAAMHALAMPEMHEWLRRAGYQASDFDQLKAIHIAGTKGKGSTSAFISAILSEYISSSSIKKIGLYTSPHLRFVRERIQINNGFITETKFADYFFEIWDRFETALVQEGNAQDGSSKPAYFRYLTIMAFHAYLKEEVESAVIECGTGGEYDSTNILQRPSVTGITSLGIDHTPMLGDTVDKIAWHKAGIMKPSAVCFTVPQPDPALEVLSKVAKERGVELRVVENVHPDIKTTPLKLSGDFQILNASLAVAIAAEHLRKLGVIDPDVVSDEKSLPAEFIRGLKKAHIGGRCETHQDQQAPIKWRIDGAHTMESMEVASKWFATCVEHASRKEPIKPRILLFNQQTREGVPLLKQIHKVLSESLDFEKPFTHAIFCTNKTFDQAGYRPDLISINTDKSEVDTLDVQERHALAWSDLYGLSEQTNTNIRTAKSIEAAIKECREIVNTFGDLQNDAEVFVTGSLHLVGGVLEVLES